MEKETVQRMDFVNELEDIARLGLRDLRSYFTGTTSEKQSRDRMADALKLISTLTRERGARSNEAARAIAIARALGLEGEELRPVLMAILHRISPPVHNTHDAPSGKASASGTEVVVG